MTWKTLKDGLVLLVDSELLIVDAQLYPAILAALPCWTGDGLVKGLANARHHLAARSVCNKYQKLTVVIGGGLGAWRC